MPSRVPRTMATLSKGTYTTRRLFWSLDWIRTCYVEVECVTHTLQSATKSEDMAPHSKHLLCVAHSRQANDFFRWGGMTAVWFNLDHFCIKKWICLLKHCMPNWKIGDLCICWVVTGQSVTQQCRYYSMSVEIQQKVKCIPSVHGYLQERCSNVIY